jgi:AraC-like DNA-binding protein
MKATLIQPNNKFLRQFIQYFFFIKNDSENYSKIHISYPNTNYCLGLYKGNKIVKISETEYEVLPSDNYRSYLTGIYQKPIQIHYQGSFNEVCIEFEPLGLEMLTGVELSNNIFVEDIIELAFPKSHFNLYDPAFRSNDPVICAAKIEEFFLQNFPEKNKFEFIPFNKINACKMEDLKALYHKSYRSIHRLYRGSLDISPKEFLNIRRLRRSIQRLHSENSLTEVAHTEDFFDQSHMTKEFKKYTNLSPKQFRKQSNLVNKTLCWTLQ